MLRLILVIYFSWGILFNLLDLIFYSYKRFKRGIKFVVTEEEGYVPVRTRMLKSFILIVFNIALLIISIKV